MAGVSLAYETLQYLLAIGASDITDLLMNTAGGAVGLLVFSALFHAAGEKGIPVLNRIALAGTVLVVAGVSLLLALTHPLKGRTMKKPPLPGETLRAAALVFGGKGISFLGGGLLRRCGIRRRGVLRFFLHRVGGPSLRW